ncbi:MAG: hypothetical protein ACN4E2_00945 [Nitrospinota bacterium]
MQRGLIKESKRIAKRGQLFPADFLFLNKREPYKIFYSLSGVRSAIAKLNYKITLDQFIRHLWATQRLDDGWTFDHISIFLSKGSDRESARIEKSDDCKV